MSKHDSPHPPLPPQDDLEGVEEDLKQLEAMNIDADFNVWSDFRSSFDVKKRTSIRSTIRDSIASASSRCSRNKRGSMQSITEDELASSMKSAKSENSNTYRSIESITEDDLVEKIGNEGNEAKPTRTSFAVGELCATKNNSSILGSSDSSNTSNDLDNSDLGESSLSFNFTKTLSSAEQSDIRKWNIRQSREQVFSRYYFPEAWEMREMKTICDFLELKDPSSYPSFLDEPGQEITRKTITSLFFPGDHDPKSVLLKRGPILYDGADERELMLFTHGFLLSRIEFESVVNLLLDVNNENPEYFRSESLRERFNAIDTDGSGELDRCELREVFTSMGMPLSEQVLSELMGKFDADDDGTITFNEFEAVMQEIRPKPQSQRGSQSPSFWNSLGSKLKKALSQSEVKRKLDCAFPLFDIERIESLNVCCSEQTKMFANSSWAELAFGIFIVERSEPLIIVCSRPEHREAWVEGFRTCVVKSIQFGSDRYSRKIRNSVGWQHKIIRDSLFSNVVSNDVAGIQRQIVNPLKDAKLDGRDDYHGYTAVHYAVILGRLDCAKLLLENGAKVNLKSNDMKTPMDHAILTENQDMVQLLKQHGGKATADKGALFESALEQEKRFTPSLNACNAGKKIASQLKEVTGALSDGMSSLRERGERLEQLDIKTSKLQNDAANYANMAKQLKEKNKKKANNIFGI